MKNNVIKSLLIGAVTVAVAWPLLSWATSKSRDHRADVMRQTPFVLVPQYDLYW